MLYETKRILGFIFYSCIQKNANPIIELADYDDKIHLLKVDYLNYPDTSLLEIIAFSNIRKSGYGVLLNLDSSYSKPELDALKLKFKRQDINAIHSFDITTTGVVQNHIRVAMDGAKFIWLLDKKQINLNTISLGRTIADLKEKKEEKVLIVTSKN